MVKAYEPKADEETKAAFFRLMHLAVVVHCPEKHFGNSSGQHLAYAADQSEWYKCLRNFYFVVGSEIKAHVSASHGSVGGREVPFVDGFVAFAARLCYVMFWNNDVWSQTDGEGGSNVKKIKRANKLQSLMDLIEVESSQPNWRWLIVLAEIVGRCPAVMCEEDYQPLLHLLSCLQVRLAWITFSGSTDQPYFILAETAALFPVKSVPSVLFRAVELRTGRFVQKVIDDQHDLLHRAVAQDYRGCVSVIF